MQNQIHSKILFQNLFWAKHMKATGFISIWERLFTGKSRVNCHCLEKGCSSLASLGECDTWSLTTSLALFALLQILWTSNNFPPPPRCCCCSKLYLFVLWRFQSQNFSLNFNPLTEQSFCLRPNEPSTQLKLKCCSNIEFKTKNKKPI